MKIGECSLCHNNGPIHIHHTQYEPEEKTIEICPNCHALIHHGDLRPDLRPPPRSRGGRTFESDEARDLQQEIERLHRLLETASRQQEEHEQQAKIMSLASDAIGEESELLEQRLGPLRAREATP
jgi:hypothetical protein